MNELSFFQSESLTDKQQEAISLHFEIKRNGEIAAAALVDFARGLKQMRDSKLFEELNFENFGDYVEKAVGIRQRQAYNYINALESLGESVLQSNAKLGITKLSILAALPAPDREEVLQNNDVEAMSTKELKELTDKLKQAEEQLSFFKSENEELKESETDDLNTIDRLEDEISRLKAALKEEQEKPVATVTKELTDEEKKKMTEDAVRAAVAEQMAKSAEALSRAQKKAEADAKKAADEAAKNAREKAEAEFKAALAASDREKKEALDRLAKMEGEAKIAASPEILRFSFYFDEAQKNLSELKTIIHAADEETAQKLGNAFEALIAQFNN